nr:hypothetical protein [uncultured Hyphomonas sp.]
MGLLDLILPKAKRSERAVRFCCSGVRFGDPLTPDWDTSLEEIESDIRAHRIDANYQDADGKSMLHHLCSELGKPKVREFAEFLVSRGASLELRDSYGNTPLLGNAHRNYAIGFCVTAGADLNVVNSKGNGVFHNIVGGFDYRLDTQRKYPDIEACRVDPLIEEVRLLVKAGADVTHRNERGDMPLDSLHIFNNALERNGGAGYKYWVELVDAMGWPDGKITDAIKARKG